jgi:succinate dehydrogenase / fumarate reductase, membrane anchor subunit
MILLLIALFHHSALGLQVVIEDYVHSDASSGDFGPARLLRFRRGGHCCTLRIAFGG